MKLTNKILLVSAALVFGFALKAAAADVTFPISELGGCTSKSDCKTYCDDVSHIDACLSFAKAHGLMSDEEITKASTFAKAAKNLTLPGNSKNPAEAKKYCSDPTHADECLAFAEKNGLIKSDEAQHGRKFAALLKSGSTPGGCDSREACETYCKDDAHREECLKFAQDNGLISKDDAERARQIKSQGGPGGCDSKDACETYCNDSAHQQECLDFAQSHGLIKKEDSEKIKDAVGRLRSQVSEHPEFKACLKQAVPSDDLEKIQNGELTPDKDTGEAVQECVQKFKDQIKQDSEKRLDAAPEAVKECIKAVVGDHGMDQLKSGEAPDPTKADQIRACMSQSQNKIDPRDRQNGSGDDGQGGPQSAGQGMPENVKKCILAKASKNSLQDVSKDDLGKLAQACALELRNARPDSVTPDQIRNSQNSSRSSSAAPDACLRKLFGDNFQQLMSRGEISQDKLAAAKRTCGGAPSPSSRPPIPQSGSDDGIE